MPDEQQSGADIRSQLWYVRERQSEVLKHLERIDERIELIRQRQDENRFRVESLERKAAELDKTIDKTRNVPTSSLLEPSVIKVLVAVLAAAFLGLAGGRLATLVGLLT